MAGVRSNTKGNTATRSRPGLRSIIGQGTWVSTVLRRAPTVRANEPTAVGPPTIGLRSTTVRRTIIMGPSTTITVRDGATIVPGDRQEARRRALAAFHESRGIPVTSARHRRPLLSAAHARYVDRRFRLTRLAHYRHTGRKLVDYSTWMERRRARGNDAHQHSDAPCVDRRTNEDRRIGS